MNTAAEELLCGGDHHLLRSNVLVGAVKAKNLTNAVVSGSTVCCIQMMKHVKRKVEGAARMFRAL